MPHAQVKDYAFKVQNTDGADNTTLKERKRANMSLLRAATFDFQTDNKA